MPDEQKRRQQHLADIRAAFPDMDPTNFTADLVQKVGFLASQVLELRVQADEIIADTPRANASPWSAGVPGSVRYGSLWKAPIVHGSSSDYFEPVNPVPPAPDVTAAMGKAEPAPSPVRTNASGVPEAPNLEASVKAARKEPVRATNASGIPEPPSLEASVRILRGLK